MKLKLVKIVEEATATKSFFWQHENPIAFTPGQYFYYTLPHLNYPDERGATRDFTIASSPTEDNLLRLTTRIRQGSGYKKTLNELPIGAEIEGQGPHGNFIFDEKETGPHIFLAGGIGITPFRSMIKYVADRGLRTPIYLIYSNSDNEFVFKSEFDEWQKNNDYIKVSYVDSSISGHLDQPKIEKLLENWKLKIENSTFWVVGPPPFTNAIEAVLATMKVPAGQIRSEKFTGY